MLLLLNRVRVLRHDHGIPPLCWTILRLTILAAKPLGECDPLKWLGESLRNEGLGESPAQDLAAPRPETQPPF